MFENAWQKVEQSGSKLASPRYKRAAQEIIAKRIIEMAQRGKRNPAELADDAVAYLERLTLICLKLGEVSRRSPGSASQSPSC